MSARAENGASEGRSPGAEASRRVDLGVKNVKITEGLAAHLPTIVTLVRGVNTFLPQDVQIETTTFDPRRIPDTSSTQHLSRHYRRTIVFGGARNLSGNMDSQVLHPDWPVDPKPIVPRLTFELIPPTGVGPEVYSKGDTHELDLSVRARVTAPVTEAEMRAAKDAGLTVTGMMDVRYAPVEIALQVARDKASGDKITTFLGLVQSWYGSSELHQILSREGSRTVYSI